MNYKFVKETGNKAAKWHYTVVDENGTVISERKSNRGAAVTHIFFKPQKQRK